MRILFVGDLDPHRRTIQRLDALRDLGHEVVGVSSVLPRTEANSRNRHSIWERLRNRLGFPRDAAAVNERLRSVSASGHYELVWVEKGVTVWPATLRYVRERNPHAAMVSFSEDDMFRRANRSAYYTWALPEYDVVFTTKSYNAEAAELPAMGARRVVFVDKGYCHRRHRPMQLSEDECRRLCADVGFVGSYERDRAELLLHLASNGVYVRVFGNGWGQWVGSHTNLEVHDRPVYGDEYVKAICATRVNLCFLRKANRDLQTSRTMEIPACGGLMLAERTMEHRRLFEEDVEAAYFDSRNPAELLHKVGYYLENETTRRSLADAGRERCITSGYSHKERLEKMLGYVAAQT